MRVQHALLTCGCVAFPWLTSFVSPCYLCLSCVLPVLRVCHSEGAFLHRLIVPRTPEDIVGALLLTHIIDPDHDVFRQEDIIVSDDMRSVDWSVGLDKSQYAGGVLAVLVLTRVACLCVFHSVSLTYAGSTVQHIVCLACV